MVAGAARVTVERETAAEAAAAKAVAAKAVAAMSGATRVAADQASGKGATAETGEVGTAAAGAMGDGDARRGLVACLGRLVMLRVELRSSTAGAHLPRVRFLVVRRGRHSASGPRPTDWGPADAKPAAVAAVVCGQCPHTTVEMLLLVALGGPSHEAAPQ